MFGHIHLVEDLHDLAVLIYQECRTVYSHVLLTVHALFGPNAVSLDDLFIGIGHEIEPESVLRAELLVRLFAVGRDAEKLDVLFFEFVVRITERARFLRSARGVVFRVEEQDDALSLEIRELNRIAVLVAGGKIWCFIAFV